MKQYRPRQIYIERSVVDSRVSRNVLEALPLVPVEWIDSTDALLESFRKGSTFLSRAKSSLVLAKHKGRFFKCCPGQQTKRQARNICCDYFVINFASNCHMECSYCYLQAYLNFPHMIVYANTDQLLAELRDQITENPNQFFRVGTGELADSLALDSLTRYSELLVKFFSEQSNAVLELKTKSTCIENLLELEHGGRTVVAWSMNPPFIQRTEEHKTATIRERLTAARQCVQAGYPVGFHFDPIIHYPAWQRDYKNLVRKIFESVPVSSVAWISLGALRMPDSLREQVRRRFPKSLLPLGELIPAEDGKLRYFKTIRVELYRRLVAWIREYGEGTPVYACMERPAIWDQAFGPTYPIDRDLGNSLIQGILGPGWTHDERKNFTKRGVI